MSELPGLDEVGVTLRELIELVDRGAREEEDALGRLPVAVAIGVQLDELGDHLVGHFVDLARHEGASWTAIGASMGVSKQAAQKKFVPGPGDIPQGRLFSRFTPRARRAVDVAHKEARRMKNGRVGTEHLVLGLLTAGGVAADVLDALGASATRVRKAVRSAAAPVEEKVPDRLPFAPATKRALEVAVREALRRHHNYIGTEHLLLALLADSDSTGSRVLNSLGIRADETARKVDKTLADIVATKVL
jgi:Clp amino terminal domain, pathogenicity island component